MYLGKSPSKYAQRCPAFPSMRRSSIVSYSACAVLRVHARRLISADRITRFKLSPCVLSRVFDVAGTNTASSSLRISDPSNGGESDRDSRVKPVPVRVSVAHVPEHHPVEEAVLAGPEAPPNPLANSLREQSCLAAHAHAYARETTYTR